MGHILDLSSISSFPSFFSHARINVTRIKYRILIRGEKISFGQSVVDEWRSFWTKRRNGSIKGIDPE